ncbi:hypothetical protein L204_102519 [Cryptococcus depauperatus]|nr:mitochondrial distribution and morphology protein 12 [Cryptococcus depauperatus CBS 7855]
MSLDIRWDLLSEKDSPDQLVDSLVTLLNTQLAQAKRPSFIGPITVISFDFGSNSPDVEIKDIRDVWRVFDQGDEEGDVLEEEERQEQERLRSDGLRSSLDGEWCEWVDVHSPTEEASSFDGHFALSERLQGGKRSQSYASVYDREPVRRPTSSRSFVPFPFDQPVPTPRLPSTPGLNPSLFSQSVAPHPVRRHVDPSSTPPSSPAHPAGLSPRPASSVPSLQLHMRLSHTSNLHLTLSTTLQVNYPSPLFMALPLRLCITGFQLEAGVIIAYNGDKNRLHLTLVDDPLTPSPSPEMGIGERILSNLQIESEIGHADAHVLRNVGKVEKFVGDVVRKTLVDELVFPNFFTVAL